MTTETLVAVAVPTTTVPAVTTTKGPRVTKAMAMIKAFFDALPLRMTCPKCHQSRKKEMFGVRVMARDRKNVPTRICRQSYCRDCRS